MSQLKPAILVFLFFTILTGVIYPLVITGIAQEIFPYEANGSIIKVGNQSLGSELIGQSFTQPKYFHSRPSGIGYDGNYIGKNYKGEDDPKNSSGTNYGPSNKKLIDDVSTRIKKFRKDNFLFQKVKVPADIVTCSA